MGAAAFLIPARGGEIHQDLSHQKRRDGKEVSEIFQSTREPYLAAPFPLRADGMGLAFADLLAESADEDRDLTAHWGAANIGTVLGAVATWRPPETLPSIGPGRYRSLYRTGDFGRRRTPHNPINTQHSRGQDLDAMRGQISGVFKLAYNCAVHRFTESHDKLSLPPSPLRAAARSGLRVGNAPR